MENALKFLSKAYDTYKEIDEAKEEQEAKMVEAFNKIPLNRMVGSDPVRSHSQI